jgi:hypothetical protein
VIYLRGPAQERGQRAGRSIAQQEGHLWKPIAAPSSSPTENVTVLSDNR